MNTTLLTLHFSVRSEWCDGDDQDSGILAEGSDDLSQSSDSVTEESGGQVKLGRKHSRASSLDRREIFNKYSNNESEHNVKLYTGDTNTKQLRVVKLRGISTRNIGVVLAKVSLADLNCEGYQVISVMEEGLAKR